MRHRVILSTYQSGQRYACQVKSHVSAIERAIRSCRNAISLPKEQLSEEADPPDKIARRVARWATEIASAVSEKLRAADHKSITSAGRNVRARARTLYACCSEARAVTQRRFVAASASVIA